MGKKPKDFLTGSENVLKNLTTEIVRICTQNDVPLRSEVISLAVSLFCLNPHNGLVLGSQLDREAIEIFVKKFTSTFLDHDKPFIKTIELQVLFMERFSSVEEMERIYEEKVNAKTEVFMQDILNFERNQLDDQDKFLQKIVIDIVLSNKLGKPSNQQVIKETTNALKSVFSRADLVEFMEAKKRKRLEILKQLRQLVCGIRVFNKDAGHCSAGVRDIVSDVSIGYKNSKAALTEALFKSNRHINSISKVLKALVSSEDDWSQLVSEKTMKFLKDSLTLYLQQNQYVSNLIDTLQDMKMDVDKRFEDFKTTLDTLHEVVKFRIAVATEKVFPHFITLSDIWKSLMTYLYVFVEINTLNDEMESVVESSESYQELLYSILKAQRNRPQKIIHSEAINITHPDCEMINITKNMSLTPAHKFCAYIFIRSGGVLVPAQRHFGVLQYKNLYFGFSESHYANIFAKDIEENVSEFMKTVRQNPQTVVFLDLFHEIVKLKIEEEQVRAEPVVEKLDVEVQTELHPVPFRKDKEYTWNIWDLRRKAIQLANIKKCSTHSVQTEISYYRLNSCLQTAQPKETSNQTMRTTSTITGKEDLLELEDKSKDNSRLKSKSISTASDDELHKCTQFDED